MFPRLRSWSERDGGSGRKVVVSGTHNDLDGLEVSNSMPPSPDQGSRTSRDSEVLRKRSSIKFALKISLSPDAQPALVPSATIDLDETHVTNEPFLPLLPASPTPESDLEMTVPLALNEKTDSIASSAPIQRFPSTASQPQDPFTQVKRTPYVNGGVQNKSLLGSKTLSSPLKANLYSLTNGTMDDDTEFVSASVTSGPETSAAETQGENGSSSTVEDRGVGNVVASVAEKSNSQNATASFLEKTNELTAEVQHEPRKAEAAASKLDDSSLIMPGSLDQSLGLNQPTVASKAEAKTRSAPENLPVPNDIYTDPHFTSDRAAQIAHEMKRKFAESSLESPSVAKRQKRFKVPSAFTFAERSEAPRDPLERARQYRQDFLASRRSSESSTPTMSPTMPFTVFPGTTSENPRDPSERARQFRQEFLASRRSSETSTPTTSPGIQFTRLTGMTQAEQRNAEVQNNVEKETVHVQSVDTETEREKVIELSSRFPTQEMKLDAAPLLNGTASTEPGGGDARLGAQNTPAFDYKADTLKLVVQNADAKGPAAESSMVIEASSHASYEEVQRAESVELDESLYSPDHQEAEIELATAKDDADQTLELGIDLIAAINDQIGNTDEDDRAVDPEPDNAREEPPTRASKVAERGGITPTPEMILNQVAEPDTAALEPQNSKPPIEPNRDTRLPDTIASELASEQQSLTVEVDTPWRDKIRTEPTSQQPLVGADTDAPMPDVQADQDITPWKSIAHTGKPINQNGSLSFVIPALVAQSNIENDPRLSPAAVKPAVSLNNPRSDFKMGPAEGHQNAVQLAVETIEQETPSLPPKIFDKFTAAYPAYLGDMNHFAAMCRQISQLVEANSMVHQSLWDDFIIRHKIEYQQYLRRCAEEAEDAVPYESCYETEIEEPLYRKRVINPRNLDEALALIAQKCSVKQMHVKHVKEDDVFVKPMKQNVTSKSDPAMETMHEPYAPDNDEGPLELVGIESAPKPASFTKTIWKPSEARVTINLNIEKEHGEAISDGEPQAEPVEAKSVLKEAASPRIAQEPSKSRVIIDLTEDDLPDEVPKTTKERQSSSHSNVPHLVNGVSLEPTPLCYQRDSSGSLYQVHYTPPAVRDSHVPPIPQSMRSPLASATASTTSTTKSNRRSLPWVESDHSILRSSPTASASNSPKRFPGLGLRDVRAKGSSTARLQFSARSTPSGAKQSQCWLETCHRVIQSNWGIKAHELLEPEYYRGQVLSGTMIELLAEIASKVKVGEARDRLKAVIDTRIRDNAWRGAGDPSQERKMLKPDLEVVRGIVETSSMSTTSPFSLPHTNAAVEKQNEGTPCKWWDDDNSPFKSFARAYASIRHGRGNSFAEADSAQPGNAEKVHEAASSGVQLKRIDITRWNM